MASLKCWIIISIFCIAFSKALTVQDKKAESDDSGSLGPIPELVFKVQQIFIKYGCAYQDRDGVCSPDQSPDCSEVKASGVCVLNSCEEQSDSDRQKVASLLAQIADIAYECDVTAEGLLSSSNSLTTMHAYRIGFVVFTALVSLSIVPVWMSSGF